jgi:hypothetical protein
MYKNPDKYFYPGVCEFLARASFTELREAAHNRTNDT